MRPGSCRKRIQEAVLLRWEEDIRDVTEKETERRESDREERKTDTREEREREKKRSEATRRETRENALQLEMNREEAKATETCRDIHRAEVLCSPLFLSCSSHSIELKCITVTL